MDLENEVKNLREDVKEIKKDVKGLMIFMAVSKDRDKRNVILTSGGISLVVAIVSVVAKELLR